MTSVRTFLDQHFLHFNARETVAASRGYENHIKAGGKMLVTLAGAMSTAKLGQILARMIRADMVHGICCTGANLEEDLFNLLAYNDYKIIEDYRALSVEDEKELYEAGFNRVTDTAIPESVMRNLERKLIDRWKKAADTGERKFEAEYLQDIFANGAMEEHYQIPAANSWLLAAWEKGIPVYSPGVGGLDDGQHVRGGGVPRRGEASPVREERHGADGAPDALVPGRERVQRRQEEGEGWRRGAGQAERRVLPGGRRDRG